MTEPSRTNHELIEENSFLKQRIQKLEHSEAERKQVEEVLRKSEEKYRLIAEKTADLISILDMNLRFTYISPATMHLRGFTVEEAMAQPLNQVLTPDSMQLGFTIFEEEMQLETSGTADPDRTRLLELEEYKKDGSIIWERSASPFFVIRTAIQSRFSWCPETSPIASRWKRLCRRVKHGSGMYCKI